MLSCKLFLCVLKQAEHNLICFVIPKAWDPAHALAQEEQVTNCDRAHKIKTKCEKNNNDAYNY